MKKRGQVTTFIILGIIIVALLIGTFYLSSYGLKTRFEIEQAKISVNEEFIPVKNYFDSCIKSISLEGANIIGLQGGYINIPRDELTVNPLVPFSNKLQIFGNDALEVPYWFYETANGIQKVQVPDKKDMENELQNYIKNNLNNCLVNFTEFQDYKINGFSDVKTEVTIDDEKIFVKVLSKLTANHKGLTQEFDKFLITLDVPLGKLYNKAKEILDKENKEYFFEQKTIDMLILYDQVPYSGINLNCNPKTWNVESIKQDFKKVIKTNIEVINPSSQKKYFKYNLDSNNIDINFKFEEDWPLFLEVNGGEQVLKENSIYGESNPAAGFLRTLFCLNNYHFVYDIKYPILVILNEKDFYFQYSTMVIIDNNQPRENRLSLNVPRDTSSIICKSGSVETIINAFDQDTNEKITNAEVKFNCVGTTCNLGKTDEDGLNVNIPACLNAVISVEKEGYNKVKTTIDTTEKGTLFLYLKPKYKKDVEIKVIDNNIRNNFDSEIVSFTLTNLDDQTQIFFDQDSKEIEVTEGNYEVSSYILRNYPNGITLPKQEIEYCNELPKPSVLGLLGFKETKCEKAEIPEVKLEQVLVGGAKFNFELSYDQIKNSNKITFYTIFNKVPSNSQELTELYNLIQKNHESNNFIMPNLT